MKGETIGAPRQATRDVIEGAALAVPGHTDLIARQCAAAQPEAA